MTVIKDAFAFLFDQNHKAKEARILRIPGDERNAYIDQDGKLTPFVIPAAPRASVVDSVDDLCAAAIAYGDAGNFSAWLSENSVVLILDDLDRRDRVTLPLRKSVTYSTLIQLKDTPKIDQAKLISLLKVELAGLVRRTELLTAVRSIKFRSLEQGHSDLQSGRESMGRSVENEVTGAGVLPEQLTLVTNLYDNPGELEAMSTIDLDLEVVASDQRFRLRPLPQSMEKAKQAALASIRDRITEALEGVRIFYGVPGRE